MVLVAWSLEEQVRSDNAASELSILRQFGRLWQVWSIFPVISDHFCPRRNWIILTPTPDSGHLQFRLQTIENSDSRPLRIPTPDSNHNRSYSCQKTLFTVKEKGIPSWTHIFKFLPFIGSLKKTRDGQTDRPSHRCVDATKKHGYLFLVFVCFLTGESSSSILCLMGLWWRLLT